MCIRDRLDTLVDVLGNEKRVIIGAQNAHYEDAGAFTGEISIPMLKAVSYTHLNFLKFCNIFPSIIGKRKGIALNTY